MMGAVDSSNSDLLIVDLDLPGLNGMVGLREFHRHRHGVKILATSESFANDLLLDCLSSGFHGCLEKTSSASEILEALERAAEGGVHIPRPLDDSKVTGSVDHFEDLTPRQRAVIEQVAEGKSNKEVARVLGISEGTVKVHVNAAYKTLGVHNRVSAALMLQPHLHSRHPAHEQELLV